MNKIVMRAIDRTVQGLKEYVDEGALNPINSTVHWKKSYGTISKKDYFKAVDKGIKETIFTDNKTKYKLKITDVSNETMWGYKIVLSYPKVLFRKIE